MEILINNNISSNYNLRNYNASIAIFDNNKYTNKINLEDSINLLLCYRKQYINQKSNLELIINNKIEYKDNKLIITLSDDIKIFGNIEDDLEDPRFVFINNDIYILYSLYKCDEYYYVIPKIESLNNNIFDINKYINNNIEKNWSIFSNNNNLYIVYSFTPNFILYENNNIIINKIFDKLNIDDTLFRCGTSPIIINNKLYFFGHTVVGINKNRNYRLSLVILDINTFDIIDYYYNIDHKLNNEICIYCRGAIYIENLNIFLLSVGVNDISFDFIAIKNIF